MDCTPEDVVGLLREYKIRSALVRVKGKVTLDVVEDSVFGNAVYKPSLVVANKADLATSEEAIESVRESARPLEVLAVSAQKTNGLTELLGSRLFDLLGIIRVYTKQPGKEPSREPIVARKGLTIGDLAKTIHSDFYERFRYARLWGPSAKFDGERVGIERELSDGDVVEFHV